MTYSNFTLPLIILRLPPSVYVDMGFNNNSPVMLTTVTSGATFSRSFSVKVTQILCTSLNRGE